jgi:hypothetical protein|nr:hypothetical protein [Kofleriaceae bacterium]
MRILLAASLALLAACGTDSAAPGQPDGPPIADGGGSGSDGFLTMISQSWSLQPGEQTYLCVRVTVSSDIYVKSIRPISPLGTHHSVLMLASHPTVPDGTTTCTSMLTDPAIYASGVGTVDLDFPDGVGLHVKAGQQLFLNLHLFNLGEAVLTGTSGIEYLPAEPSEIVHEAGSVLAGKTTGLVVVPGTSSQTGTCTTPANETIFAVAPHMHLLGSHMTATYQATGSDAPVTVLDTDYSFDDQKFRPVDPEMVTAAGGKYVVTCSYVNSTGSTVYFGESTEDEMCFAMTYVYPALDEATCTK